MSVFIKGIRMPDGCVNCPLSASVNFGVLCIPTRTMIPDSKLFDDVGEPLGRQDWCPIIDVLTEQDLFPQPPKEET